MDISDRLAHAYFFAKHYVISRGYGNEIDWQDYIDFEKLTAQKLLEEFSWVVIASGMNDNVVRKIYPRIKAVMYNFSSTELIVKNKESCFDDAIKIFNHQGKIKAILYLAEYLQEHSFDIVKTRIKEQRDSFIQNFPYMGKATTFHFMKNIGLDVAKPDRHLTRISSALGFSHPNALCEKISQRVEEKISTVDVVIWRYATLDKCYLEKLNWIFRNK